MRVTGHRALATAVLLGAVALAGTAGAAGPSPEQKPGAAPEAAKASPLDPIREDLLALRFEKVVDAVNTLLEDPATSDAIRLEALVLRSEAHAASGNLAAAEEDYREILPLYPAFEPDPNLASKKAVARFAKVRASMVGVLKLVTDPPDARVVIDGREGARTGDGSYPALAGTRTLRVERRGFDADERQVVVEAGKEVALGVRLVPNARSVVIRTEPEGVRVLVDGKEAGPTERRRGDDGLPVSDAPAEILLEDLPLGEHVFTLAKPCFLTVTLREMLAVDLLDHGPRVSDTVNLVPTRSRLTLRSSIPRADLVVDGKAAGPLAPAPLELCPGTHVVEVHAGGRTVWSQEVNLPEEGAMELDVAPRPNLVVAGDRPLPSTLEPFTSAFNLRGTVRLPPGDPESPDSWAAAGQPADTDLVLGVAPAVSGATGERALLYSPILRTVVPLDSAPPRPDPPSWSRTVAGLRLADSATRGTAIVVEVVPRGPAAAAGIVVGDRISMVAGRKVASSREAVAAVRGQHAGVPFEVQVTGATGEARTVRLTPQASPLVAGAAERGEPAPLLAAWAATAASAGGPDSPAALASLGLLLLESRRAAASAETWRKVTLPERAGIGTGTVAYYLGRALDDSGKEEEARAAFERARSSAATATDDEGLVIAPAAADHLADLGGSPGASGAATGR